MAFLQKRGKYWYIYWRQDGKKHGKSLKTTRKSVAQQYLKEFEYKLATRQLGQTTDIGLDQLRDEYLLYSKATKKQSTYERHDEPRVNRFVDYLTECGVRKASEITPRHVQDYQHELLDDLATSTVRHTMFAASGMLTFAVERGYIESNPVKKVKKPKVTKNPPRYLSFDEWEEVRAIAEQTELWPLVATAYYTGFRNSELRFLRWEEIDFERNVITLRNKEGFTLKNRESRTVPLNKELKRILQPLKKKSGYCFLNRKGQQFGATQLTRRFKKVIVEPSGLPDFTLHTLRHTFASHLVMKGVSIYKVSRWLGHKSVNTTMIYAHLAPQDDEINAL
ncbi:MAG: tyrosine-type recombinase/integrase [Planctomycetota bacterium]